MKEKKDNQGKIENIFIIIFIIISVFLIIGYQVFMFLKPKAILYLEGDYSITYEESLEAIDIMDKWGINSNSEEWKESKNFALKELETANNTDEYLGVLGKYVRIAGTKHTLIIAGEMDKAQKHSEKTVKTLPETYIKDNVLVLKLFTTINGEMSDEYYIEYANVISKAIYENKDMDGVVVDLTEDTGGSMFAMIGGFISILPDGEVYKSVNNKNEEMTTLEIKNNELLLSAMGESESMIKVDYAESKINKPVAILTSKNTSSAGELTLLSFKGVDCVKSFGKETKGAPTGISEFNIGKNIKLALTSSKIKDRNGEIYDEEPITPDVNINSDLLDAAINWIKNCK